MEDADRILLAQDSALWRAVVNTIMNLRAQYKTCSFLTSIVVARILFHGVD